MLSSTFGIAFAKATGYFRARTPDHVLVKGTVRLTTSHTIMSSLNNCCRSLVCCEYLFKSRSNTKANLCNVRFFNFVQLVATVHAAYTAVVPQSGDLHKLIARDQWQVLSVYCTIIMCLLELRT